jgi:hypothetical protein
VRRTWTAFWWPMHRDVRPHLAYSRSSGHARHSDRSARSEAVNPDSILFHHPSLAPKWLKLERIVAPAASTPSGLVPHFRATWLNALSIVTATSSGGRPHSRLNAVSSRFATGGDIRPSAISSKNVQLGHKQRLFTSAEGSDLDAVQQRSNASTGMTSAAIGGEKLGVSEGGLQAILQWGYRRRPHGHGLATKRHIQVYRLYQYSD